MIIALLATAALLTLVVCLISFVQMLYIESLRLRTRDLPALEFFKQTFEKELGMKAETGVLSFLLIKYTLIMLISLLILDGFCGGRPITWIAFTEAAIASWVAMLMATCLVPYVLYRRTSGEWLMPFAPVLKGLALLVWPLVFTLEFIESLMNGSGEEKGHEEP